MKVILVKYRDSDRSNVHLSLSDAQKIGEAISEDSSEVFVITDDGEILYEPLQDAPSIEVIDAAAEE